MTSSYCFDVTCGICGGELQHINEGGVGGIERKAIAACKPCRKTWLVKVELVELRSTTTNAEAVRQHRARAKASAA